MNSIKVIVRSRQAGKTTEAIKLAGEKYAYIVCPDVQQVRFIEKLARDMGIKIPLPLTWREFVEKHYYGAGVKGFVIDNLDQCLQSMTSVNIEAVTFNEDDPSE